MKRLEMAAVLARGQVHYQEIEINEEFLIAWYELFKNEDIRVFQTAFMHTIKNSNWFPNPAEVSQNILKVKQALRARQGLRERTAPSEWMDILKYASRNDFKGVLERVSKCKASKQALEVIGFDNIRLANVQTELFWLRKEFIQIWENVNNQQESNKNIGLSHEQSTTQISQIEQNLGKKLL